MTNSDLQSFTRFITVALLFLFAAAQDSTAQAQLNDGRKVDLRAGFNVTYQNLSFTGDAAELNDLTDYGLGGGFQLQLNWYFLPRFSLSTGFSYLYFDWEFNDTEMPATNEAGQPTGNTILTTMGRGFNVIYAGLPLHLRIHPYASHFYLMVGSDLWYKALYKNGQLDSFLVDQDGVILELIASEPYATPTLAEDWVVSGVAGIGFGFSLDTLRFGIEFNARQNITPFFSRQGVTQNFTQFGMSVNVRL